MPSSPSDSWPGSDGSGASGSLTPSADLHGADAEMRSLKRHDCPECGGKGEWDPAKRALVCSYCGKVFDSPAGASGAVEEHDLDEMLARLSRQGSTVQTGERRVQCSNCHAVLVQSANTMAQHCQFCGSPELLDYQAVDSPIAPESLLPAGISKEKAYHALKDFLRSRWFAPGDLKTRNLIEKISRVYLPYWTFDAAVECPWTADSGTYYYVDVPDGTDDEGRPKTRREQRTEWRPARGHVSTSFDDLLISGSTGLDEKLLKKIEPFPTEQLVPYDTSYVSGWQVEHYQVPLDQAARTGFSAMRAVVHGMCVRQIPGDTYRQLEIYPSYSDCTFKHILAPIWLLAYQYRGKTWQGAVNAVTGTAYARFPLSVWKITSPSLVS